MNKDKKTRLSFQWKATKNDKTTYSGNSYLETIGTPPSDDLMSLAYKQVLSNYSVAKDARVDITILETSIV